MQEVNRKKKFVGNQQKVIKEKVLIIVPTLNSYKCLEKLISSLKKQISTDWRVLFVDGLSSPKHKSFLKKVCLEDKRFTWENQSARKDGIFGAMNLGFKRVLPNEWLLFWGSDDWLPSKNSLSVALRKITEVKCKFNEIDIFVCNSRYYSPKKKKLTRLSFFIRKNRFVEYYRYKLLLFSGRTPPHQTTFLSKTSRDKINNFSKEYKLSADLNFFLKLSNFKNIKIYNFDYELLYLSEGGISGIKTTSRLKEVLKAYFEEFSYFCIIPFLLRYLFKVSTRSKVNFKK